MLIVVEVVVTFIVQLDVMDVLVVVEIAVVVVKDVLLVV